MLRRLNRLPAPAADVAQDLVNSVFTQLDASLRELGVGDMGVPKRMKKLGAAFYGRAAGYDAALDAGDDGGAARGARPQRARRGEGDAARASPPTSWRPTRPWPAADLDGLLGAGPPFPAPDASPRVPPGDSA